MPGYLEKVEGESCAAADMDFDGDGMADLVLQYDHSGQRRWQARLSIGAAFDYSGDWSHTGTANVLGGQLVLVD
ncbi:MAG: hypothetical protein ACI8RZ_007157 [Myxococcota bacterium]